MSHPEKSGPVVFMPHYHEAIHTFLPVIRELESLNMPVLMLLDARDAGSPAVCEKLGLKWMRIPAFAWGRRLAGGPAVFLRESLRAWRFARHFFEKIRPALLVMTDDRRYVEAFLLRQAAKRGVFGLVIMWAATNRADAMKTWRQKAAYNNPPSRLKYRFQTAVVRRIAPQALVPDQDGRYLLWQPLNAIVSMRLFGCYPPHPWMLGGGCASAVAVIGTCYRDMMTEEGICPEKIHVTGHPRHDRLFHHADHWRGPERAEICREIGAPPDKKLVLLGASPVNHILQGTRAGHVSPEQLLAALRNVTADLLDLGPEYHLVVKIHPRDTGLDLPWLKGHDRPLSVVRDYDIARIIAASDLLVCQGSTVVLDAHILGTPVVTFDFYNTPGYDMWDRAGGVLHVRNAADFPQAVRRALHDERTRADLQAGREKFLQTHVRCDGQATARIMKIIRDAMI